MVLTLSHYARYCSAQVLYSDSPSSPMTSRLYSSEYTCSNVGGCVLSSAVSCTAPTSMWCALLPAAGFRDPVARLPPDQMEPPSFSRGGDGCTPNTVTRSELARHMCLYWGSRGAQTVKLELGFAFVLSRGRSCGTPHASQVPPARPAATPSLQRKKLACACLFA